jgi:hypothetical protein
MPEDPVTASSCSKLEQQGCAPRERWRGGPILPALILFLLFSSLLRPGLVARAAAFGGTGMISGHLLDGSRNNAPVAGQSVTLQMAQGGTARDLLTVKSDGAGSFVFKGLATGSDVQYAVYTRYQGAQYVTDLIDLSKQPVKQVNLTVYDATHSSANLAVVQATILIQAPDASKGTFTVSEIYFFQNVGKLTYVGSLDGSKGRPNALLFSLPGGARNVSLDQGFNSVEAVQVDNGFASDAAVPPGQSEFSFSFEVPYQAESYDFAYTFFYPTVQLSILTPPALRATSAALPSKGLIVANNHPYLLLQSQDFRPGDQVHVKLQGLPLASSSSFGALLTPGWLWLLIGIALMVLIIVISSLLYQRLQHRHSRKRSPQRQREAARSRPAAAALEEGEEEELFRHLLELDKAFEAGKLSQTEYTEQRARLKERLRLLMSVQEARVDENGGGNGQRSAAAHGDHGEGNRERAEVSRARSRRPGARRRRSS